MVLLFLRVGIICIGCSSMTVTRRTNAVPLSFDFCRRRKVFAFSLAVS